VDKNGKIITEGEQIEIGGNDKYISMCWGCWQTVIAEQEKN